LLLVLSQEAIQKVGVFNKVKNYKAHFELDKPLERTRLFWKSDFADEIKSKGQKKPVPVYKKMN